MSIECFAIDHDQKQLLESDRESRIFENGLRQRRTLRWIRFSNAISISIWLLSLIVTVDYSASVGCFLEYSAYLQLTGNLLLDIETVDPYTTFNR